MNRPQNLKNLEFFYLTNSALSTAFQKVVIHVSVNFCSGDIEFIPIFGHMGTQCWGPKIDTGTGTMTHSALGQQI